MFEILGGIFVLTIMILISGLKVVKEYDQLVIFRFGKALGTRGPGLQLVVPVIDRGQLVDTRLVTLPLSPVEETTSDNLTVRVDAVCIFQVVDGKRAVTKVQDTQKATRETAEITLRGIIHQHDFRHLLWDRPRMDGLLKARLDRQTREWGIRVRSFEIKQVKIPRDVRKALARQRKGAFDHVLQQTQGLDHMDRVSAYLTTSASSSSGWHI